MAAPRIPNIIVFGATGSGKSSVVNMLQGDRAAWVSSGSAGATFATQVYRKTINDTQVNIYDTVGLNEAINGTISPRTALESLYQLTRTLNDGIDLLVFVVRAPRITELVQQNYEMFYDILCQRAVPIDVVITGLEGEPDMRQWWDENRSGFERHQMVFSGHACITAIHGPLLRNGTHAFQSLYDQSCEDIESLIKGTLPSVPWKGPPKSNWFATSAQRSLDIWAKVLQMDPISLEPTFRKALTSYGAVLGPEALSDRQPKRSSTRLLGSSTTPNIVIIGPAADEVLRLLSNTTEPFKKTEANVGTGWFDLYEIPSLHNPKVQDRPEDVIKTAYQVLCHRLMCNIHLVIYAVQREKAESDVEALRDYHFLSLLTTQVPVALVVTGDFDPATRDRWWVSNRGRFDQEGMRFNEYTTLANGDDKETRRKRLEQLIGSAHSRVSLQTVHKLTLSAVVLSCFAKRGRILAPTLKEALVRLLDLPEGEAVKVSNQMARDVYFSISKK